MLEVPGALCGLPMIVSQKASPPLARGGTGPFQASGAKGVVHYSMKMPAPFSSGTHATPYLMWFWPLFYRSRPARGEAAGTQSPTLRAPREGRQNAVADPGQRRDLPRRWRVGDSSARDTNVGTSRVLRVGPAPCRRSRPSGALPLTRRFSERYENIRPDSGFLCHAYEQFFNLSLPYTNTAWNLPDTTSTGTLRGRW